MHGMAVHEDKSNGKESLGRLCESEGWCGGEFNMCGECSNVVRRRGTRIAKMWGNSVGLCWLHRIAPGLGARLALRARLCILHGGCWSWVVLPDLVLYLVGRTRTCSGSRDHVYRLDKS